MRRVRSISPMTSTSSPSRPEGLREAPLAGGVKDELITDTTDKETVFTLNQHILEEIDISRRAGLPDARPGGPRPAH